MGVIRSNHAMDVLKRADWDESAEWGCGHPSLRPRIRPRTLDPMARLADLQEHLAMRGSKLEPVAVIRSRAEKKVKKGTKRPATEFKALLAFNDASKLHRVREKSFLKSVGVNASEELAALVKEFPDVHVYLVWAEDVELLVADAMANMPDAVAVDDQWESELVEYLATKRDEDRERKLKRQEGFDLSTTYAGRFEEAMTFASHYDW